MRFNPSINLLGERPGAKALANQKLIAALKGRATQKQASPNNSTTKGSSKVSFPEGDI